MILTFLYEGREVQGSALGRGDEDEGGLMAPGMLL